MTDSNAYRVKWHLYRWWYHVVACAGNAIGVLTLGFWAPGWDLTVASAFMTYSEKIGWAHLDKLHEPAKKEANP